MWAATQPNNVGGVQFCAALDRESDWRMADEACDGYSAYLCDIREYSATIV